MKYVVHVAVVTILMCLGCRSTPQETQEKDKDLSVTIEGDFRSIQGVMDQLSCYCFNGGYVTLESGEQVAACFEEDAEVRECDRIKITGVQEEIENNPEKSSPCPKGTMSIMNVTTFECL